MSLAAVLVLTVVTPAAAGGPVPDQAVGTFERPDAAAIRSALSSVLADPDHQPRRSFWQWFGEKLSRWQGPDVNTDSAWVYGLQIVLLLWCVLSLVAVLAHMVWTLVIWLSADQRWGGAARRRLVASRGQTSASYEDLCQLAERQAQRGAYRDAISTMMLALLRWLDTTGVIRFHESKTNGDYLTEYPDVSGSRSRFRQFVVTAEAAMYSRTPCGRDTYQDLSVLSEHVQNHVSREQTI